jgi:AmiR/NasT family two-component response regulator
VATKRLALAADLMFASRIRAAATAMGVDLTLARTPAELEREAKAHSGSVALVDLETRGLDIAATVRALRTAGVGIVAFVSHVRTDLIAAAKEAGVERVLARSAFVRQLPDLLR